MKVIHLIIIIIPILFIACFGPSTTMYKSYDIVTESSRMTLSYTIKDKDKTNKLYSLRQTIVKKTSKQNESVFAVYDELYFNSTSFALNEEVYIIVDQKPFKLNILQKDQQKINRTQNQTSRIMTADSSSVNVVTGTIEHNSKIYRLQYILSDEIIKAITNSEEVLFRYYAGPDMITLSVKKDDMNKLKTLISASLSDS